MFTAHIREIDNEEQPVAVHCRETQELAQKYAAVLNADAIAALQGLLHDIGKLTTAFHAYIHKENECKRGEIDHSFAGAKYLCELAEKTEDANLMQTAQLIARTILSHHGLHDWVDEKGTDCFRKRIEKTERYQEVLTNLPDMVSEAEIMEWLQRAGEQYCNIRKTIFALCKGEGSGKGEVLFCFYLGMLERWFQSVLMDADRTNTADFASGFSLSLEQDTAALWEQMQQRMDAKLAAFADKNDPISMQRKSISERCYQFAAHPVGICRLIVPTGGGKTLSSLRFAIRYCKEHEMKKIIYVAPFMSILEQNSAEIRAIAGEEVFLEHHSNILQELDTPEELSAYELRTERWDTPVIATTMVQFLNTLFSGKSTSVRRMHRLSRAVIILDEVQSIPLKCVHLFNLAINFLSKICGCTIVLCTATQPNLEEVKYPLLLDESSNMIEDYAADFTIFRRTELIPCLKDCGYTFATAAAFGYEKYLAHDNLLMVVNTKAAAQHIYQHWKECNDAAPEHEKAELIHLSTNMCPAHRKKKIEQLRDALEHHRRVICVTTQLIEAGVDISFGCVVRSLAGMDNAAQAAGRCNRHGEYKTICPVYLINIREEKVTKLKEITMAQTVSRQMIGNDSITDYLSPDTMEEYFWKYYHENKMELSYPVKAMDTTLLNLLSTNQEWWQMRKNQGNKRYAQAFRTAGSFFQVIDQQTTDVLVYYDADAEDLITKLHNENRNPHEMMQLLRKAQKYTVSLYAGMRKALTEAGALHLVPCGDSMVLVLQKEYYDDACGVVLQGNPLEPMIY